MHTKFSRQIWAYDPNYTRVEALDESGQPLGYVYFEPRTACRSQARPARFLGLRNIVPQVCRQVVLNLCGAVAS
jgi:hypothetical protein